MESIAVTPEKFETEVLKSDKPALVLLLPIDFGDESDASDDLIQFFGKEISLAEFKSEVQKAAGEQYKVALVDQRDGYQIGVPAITPRIFPPPIPFVVYEKGEPGKAGFLMTHSQDAVFGGLKQHLGN